MQKPISHLRKNYSNKKKLSKQSVHSNPIDQFQCWFKDALEAGLVEPNAMTLATVDQQGRPSARMVLLKNFDRRGFVFYTNYRSRKAMELNDNSSAYLVFWWDILARQIRIGGITNKINAQESDDYFSSRGRGSQLGTWASNQSKVISDRAVLEHHYQELEQNYQGKDIPRPPQWGGYRLIPKEIEFWQGRENRLHDRICYRLANDDRWTIDRLAP